MEDCRRLMLLRSIKVQIYEGNPQDSVDEFRDETVKNSNYILDILQNATNVLKYDNAFFKDVNGYKNSITVIKDILYTCDKDLFDVLKMETNLDKSDNHLKIIEEDEFIRYSFEFSAMKGEKGDTGPMGMKGDRGGDVYNISHK